MNIKKSTIAIAIIAVATFSLIKANEAITPETENDFIKKLKNNFTAFFEAVPQDRVYLQFDKTMYEPGETAWFSGYVVDAKTMQSSNKSEILHVDIISPKGTIEKKLNIICKNGKAAGEYAFADDAVGGIYKIRAYTNWQKNEPDSLYFEKEIQVQAVVLPKLKMALEFERKAFGANDDAIAKLTLQTNDNKPLSNYNFTYEAQVNGEKITSAKAITGNDGVMYIKFKLPNKLKSNDGLLNVMIDYEGNTESISRSIPIILNNINLVFYPEGGDLIEGAESRIAFKAANEFGKPADIEGEILNNKGEKVSTFSSYHQGMGAFFIKTKTNENYVARITKPSNISTEFALPMALNSGITMSVTNNNSNTIKVSLKSSDAKNVSVVAMMRDKIYYSTAANVGAEWKDITIPQTSMPMGVCRITVFDNNNVPCCERLTFVNMKKQLNVAIKTDKEKYQPREKVTATISVKDDEGRPVAANLSLTVTNDQMLSFADDKQGNLLSELFLQQDVKGKIEEPAFYFSKQPKAIEALDYLLMTNGWRRFAWLPVIQAQKPSTTNKAENTIIAGTVLDGATGRPLNGVTIKIGNTQITTNPQGKFMCRNVDLSKKTVLTANMQGYQKVEETITSYQKNKIIDLFDLNYVEHLKEMPMFDDRMPMVQEMRMQMAAPAGMMNDEIKVMGLRNDKQDANPRKRAEAEAKAKAEAGEKGRAEAEGAAKAGAEAKAKAEQEARVKAPKDVRKKAEAEALAKRKNIGLVEADDANGAPAPNFKRLPPRHIDAEPAQNNIVTYHIAREFAMPNYSTPNATETRTDFRKTIYWNPNIDIDNSGTKTIEFYCNDEITSFRAIAEGIGSNGYGAHCEHNIFTQLPFSITAKFPVEMVQDDVLEIPLTIKNNTAKLLTTNVVVSTSSALSKLTDAPLNITIEGNSTKTILVQCKAISKTDDASFSVTANAGYYSDAFSNTIKILPKGIPVLVSFSGKETDASYMVDIDKPVAGSIVASVTAYPSVVSDLLKGIESILQEPSGCFEQTSMSSYPNVLVRKYLQTAGIEDAKLQAKADGLIERGYKKLISFETKEKGYEWFGGAPGHEALTAYGLMQFNDMKGVYTGVDNTMIDRTADWLMASRDGNGGYKRNPRALDNFGGADKEITNAYITYALAAAGYNNIDKEIDYSEQLSASSDDAYILGLTANALFDNKKTKRAEKVLQKLVAMQEKDGSFMGKKHSITRSTDKALRIETTSLAIMAMLQATANRADMAITNAVEYLIKARDGGGSFGNSQSTIMALKALTKYAEYSKQTNEDGVLECYIDGNKFSEAAYKAGTRDAIVISGLEKMLSEGKHKISLKYRATKNPLPYSVSIGYNTYLPQTAKECNVNLNINYASQKVKQGETVRLKALLKNKTAEGLASTMAIVALPANCTAQPWQLKEMQEKKMFDYYETKGNSIIIYYRQMAPNEEKVLNFDLKAEIIGKVETPASSAYLYYTNEYKHWEAPTVVEVY